MRPRATTPTSPTPTRCAKTLRTPFFHDGTCRPSAAAAHGRPVDAGDRPGLAVRGVAADPRPGRQPRAGRPALDARSTRPGPARLRRRDPADLAVDADAVHGRGVGRPHAVAVLHRPHRPRDRRGHRAAAGKAEFGSHGWDERDVPDPQDPETFRRSRLDWSEPAAEPHARLLAWYRDLIGAAAGRARPARPPARPGRRHLVRPAARHDPRRVPRAGEPRRRRLVLRRPTARWCWPGSRASRVAAGSVDVPARSAVLLRIPV